MTQKEKIAAVLTIASFFILTASCIYTLIQNKPADYKFRIESLF